MCFAVPVRILRPPSTWSLRDQPCARAQLGHERQRVTCFVQPPSANALASVRPGRTIVLSRRAMRDLAREHPTIRSQLAGPQSRPERVQSKSSDRLNGFKRKKRVPQNLHELVDLWWSYGQYKLALVAPKGRGEPLYIYIYYWFMDDGGRSPQSFRKAL